MNNTVYKIHLWWYKFEHKRLVYIAIGIWLCSLVIIASVFHFRWRHHNEPHVVGVSYSLKTAHDFDISVEDSFTALLDDLQIREFRLMSYWDLHEKDRNIYDFSELDLLFEEVGKRNGSITLSIGARQPRWPECHIPEWAKNLDKTDYQAELLEYISEVVNRYKSHPALDTYQLENEAVLKSFGVCEEPDRKLLRQEYELVKSLDSSHKVIMSQSNQYGFPVRGPEPDAYGFSVYKKVHEGRILNRVITHPIPAWYHSFRANIIEIFHQRPVIIHELQMEPWGDRATQKMSIDEQNQSMSTKQIHKNFKFAKKTGIKTMYLWGAEWWYWRTVEYDDPSIWETVRAEVDTLR